jgi:hypothetical protein
MDRWLRWSYRPHDRSKFTFFSTIDSFILQIGKCLVRTGLVRTLVDHPMIPVDIVANMTIAIVWFTATNNNSYIQ